MTATTMTAGFADGGGTRLFGPRGRHRKPRPRKVLLAAGGLALAAGALSLVRLTPDTGVGGYGAAEADAQPDPTLDSANSEDSALDTGTDRATYAAATVGAVPQASPSSTTAMGGFSATPTPTGAATAVPLPLAAAPTTIPDAPNTPAPVPATATPHPRTTTPAAPQPQPAPTTAPQTNAPAPQPTHAADPGLCVPIIGLCVDPLTRR